MGAVAPDFSNQIHDYNPGIAENGLFWTIPFAEEGAWIDLAAGKTLEQITSGTHLVSEGIRNSLAVSRLAAARGVDMPITRQMAAVMYEGKDPRRAVEELMTRELKSESEL